MREMEIPKKRIMALDIGSVRIGIAIWEPQSQLAQCLPFLKRKTLQKDLEFLARLVEEKEIEAFLVGLPLSLGGKITTSTKNALFWVESLKKSFQLPVYTYDESLSSKDALKILKRGKSSKAQSMKDSLSAALFLEEFIRAQSSTQ